MPNLLPTSLAELVEECRQCCTADAKPEEQKFQSAVLEAFMDRLGCGAQQRHCFAVGLLEFPITSSFSAAAAALISMFKLWLLALQALLQLLAEHGSRIRLLSCAWELRLLCACRIYPHIETFVKEKAKDFHPQLKVADRFGVAPRLLMRRPNGSKEVIRIDGWKTEHIEEYLQDKLVKAQSSKPQQPQRPTDDQTGGSARDRLVDE